MEASSPWSFSCLPPPQIPRIGSIASLRPPKVANVQFDADGDILLLLPSFNRVARFQVSSSALCLASPVFRTMLSTGRGGRFKESKDLQEKKSGEPTVEITLKDDNPDALAVILRIIHHQHDFVPESLSERNLWQIAILVDKYDLREVTKLWIELWVRPYLKPNGSPLPSSSYFKGYKGIFLAYAFGNGILFKRISKGIILNWESTPDQHIMRPRYYVESLLGTDSFEFVPQSIVGMYSFNFIDFNLQNLRGTLSKSKGTCRRDVQVHWPIYQSV